MIFGIQFYMFKVRYAVKGSNALSVSKCAQKDHGTFVVLENKDAAIEKLDGNQLKALYTFFTGKELKPFPRYLSEAWPKVTKVFDEKKFEAAAGFKIPPFEDHEEPLTVSVQKSKERQANIPELKHTGPEPYNPQLAKAASSDPADAEPEDEEEDTTMAAKKTASKKSAKKTAAKKAPKKAAANGAAGRKARYNETAKIKANEKENPCNPTFAGKPSRRHGNYALILKNSGFTFADYIKKGGNATDLFDLQKKEYVTVTG